MAWRGVPLRNSPRHQLAVGLITTRSLTVAALLLAFAGCAALAALQEVVDQLGTGVTHFHVERLDPAGEIVVRPHRRHSHKQTDSGSDESFGNTAGDRAQAG